MALAPPLIEAVPGPAALSAAATRDEDTCSDADLMARVASGNREAMARIVDRHKHPLVNYLTRLSGHRDRGEDLAQEAFLRLFLAAERGGYREEGKFAAFLYRIATNLARSEGRRARRFLTFGGGGGAAGEEPGRAERDFERRPDPAADAETGLLRRESRRLLERALAQLPLRFRVPVVLFAIEGWSHEAIADFLGCRPGTVKSRIHRGRERLRHALARQGHGQGVQR